jgi:hypothetical protein
MPRLQSAKPAPQALLRLQRGVLLRCRVPERALAGAQARVRVCAVCVSVFATINPKPRASACLRAPGSRCLVR